MSERSQIVGNGHDCKREYCAGREEEINTKDGWIQMFETFTQFLMAVIKFRVGLSEIAYITTYPDTRLQESETVHLEGD